MILKQNEIWDLLLKDFKGLSTTKPVLPLQNTLLKSNPWLARKSMLELWNKQHNVSDIQGQCQNSRGVMQTSNHDNPTRKKQAKGQKSLAIAAMTIHSLKTPWLFPLVAL